MKIEIINTDTGKSYNLYDYRDLVIKEKANDLIRKIDMLPSNERKLAQLNRIKLALQEKISRIELEINNQKEDYYDFT